MSAKETLNTVIETVTQSLVQAKVEHTVALTTAGTGAITGSVVLQILAGMVSVAVLFKTGQDIWLNARKIRDEKKD